MVEYTPLSVIPKIEKIYENELYLVPEAVGRFYRECVRGKFNSFYLHILARNAIF